MRTALISWLQGLLLPQENMKITIRVLVSQKLAAELNLGSRRLDHTLIIRLALGRDLFLAVSGEYGPSCVRSHSKLRLIHLAEPTVFGNSVETLSRLSGSIRIMKGVAELKDTDKARGNAKVVMKLIGWLMDKGSSEVGNSSRPGANTYVRSGRSLLVLR
jgi:inositol polyphosphate 5-phosphatase INPP5B/F